MNKPIKVVERYEDNDDFSETLFSYHRYLALQKFCFDKVVVDMACGTGYGSNLLSINAKKVFGFDIDTETIEKCKMKYNRPNIFFSTSTVSKINLKDKSVDVFISCETIEHVVAEEQKKFISEIKRILKKNGTVIVTTPNKERTDMFDVKNPYHLRELYPNDLIDLIKKEFEFFKLFYMDINMVSCIFDSDIQAIEKSNIIKFSHYSNESKMSQKPIYMLIICSNNIDNIKSIASVLYDCEYKFSNYIWNQISEKKSLEEEIEKCKLKISEEIIRNDEKEIVIKDLERQIDTLKYNRHNILKKLYLKVSKYIKKW